MLSTNTNNTYIMYICVCMYVCRPCACVRNFLSRRDDSSLRVTTWNSFSFGRRTFSRSLCLRVRMYVHKRQYAAVVLMRVCVCVCVVCTLTAIYTAIWFLSTSFWRTVVELLFSRSDVAEFSNFRAFFFLEGWGLRQFENSVRSQILSRPFYHVCPRTSGRKILIISTPFS